MCDVRRRHERNDGLMRGVENAPTQLAGERCEGRNSPPALARASQQTAVAGIARRGESRRSPWWDSSAGGLGFVNARVRRVRADKDAGSASGVVVRGG